MINCWEESHEVQFFNGVAAFELGNKVEIKTYFFHEKGTQLILSVNGESISLPIYSTSFSLFSHARQILLMPFKWMVFFTLI